MMHIEIHVVKTDAEAQSLESLGLIEFGDEDFCEHCGETVAYIDDSFIECGIVLDGETEFLLCTDCLFPVIDPGNF